ncbi:penicillin-binding protein [Streptosporangium violaceochromogenes]|nr:penicillin-binding protein [Streptosporangium violaceochromogenes]
MRSRAVFTLAALVLFIVGASVYALSRPAGPGSAAGEEGPEETGRSYLASWEDGDFAAMSRLVADRPGDFVQRHLEFARDLRIESLRLVPGTLRRRGQEAAELPFEGVRQVKGLGEWPFASVLRLALREGHWRVLWAPETIHPALAAGGRIEFREIPAPAAEPVTRSGEPFPRDSGAERYLSSFGAGEERTGSGYALETVQADGRTRELAVFKAPETKGALTTISRQVQAAAARALDGVSRPAAIVAVRGHTGEVLAVADRLGGGNDGQNAFRGLYPPGSAFKLVTTTALFAAGLSPDSPTDCPASYTPPGGRPFGNAGGHSAPGPITLATAFAISCNTAFITQTARLPAGGEGLVRAAELFGFNRDIEGPGVCGRIVPPGDGNALASDAIGQGSVVASPLCMALAAAAVQDGSWHQPVMTPQGRRSAPVRLPEKAVAGLRAMMLRAVTAGTASSGGLPSGTAGKTGTAQVAGEEDDAWFVGYRGDTAFAVLVLHGGSGASAAVPVAARFLRAL